MNDTNGYKKMVKECGEPVINFAAIDHYIEVVEPTLDKKLEKLKS